MRPNRALEKELARAPYPEFDGTQACASMDPEKFFGEAGQPRGTELAWLAWVCSTCSFQADCLAYAMDRPDIVGWWGGTSERGRRLIRAKRKGGGHHVA